MSPGQVAAGRPERRALKAVVAVLIVLAAAGLDQGTKALARARLQGSPPVSAAGGFVTLYWVENEGAFLSLGARLPRPVRMAVFVAFPLVVLGFMVASLARRKGVGWGTLAGLSLIVGGGAGNLVDRIFRGGRVGDFLLLRAVGFQTGVFNAADLAVLAGCIVLLLAPSSRGRKPRDGERRNDQAQDQPRDQEQGSDQDQRPDPGQGPAQLQGPDPGQGPTQGPAEGAAQDPPKGPAPRDPTS